MKLGLKVKGKEAPIYVGRLQIHSIPKLHAGYDHRTNPEHRLLSELANVRDELVHRALPAKHGLEGLVDREL